MYKIQDRQLAQRLAREGGELLISLLVGILSGGFLAGVLLFHVWLWG